MKRIIMALLVIAGISFANKSMAQKVTFYYYPDANVYYNPHTHQYAYADNDNWQYGSELPSTVHLGKRHVTVYGTSDNDEIWRDNEMHRQKYLGESKKEVKHDYREAKKEDKHMIKKEKKEEKREVKHED